MGDCHQGQLWKGLSGKETFQDGDKVGIAISNKRKEALPCSLTKE